MEHYPDPADSSTVIENPRRFLGRATEAVLRFPDSLPLWIFRAAQRVRWGDLEYQVVWSTLYRAALESGAPESWVRRELYNGFANAAAFKAEPPHLTAMEDGSA